MSNFTDGSYSSAAAAGLIAKLLADEGTLHYTRAALGSGNIPDGMTPAAMTEPAGYVMDAGIASVTNPADGECHVTVQINSDDVQTGFSVTGLLLYAEDPDSGEVPYTYLVLENAPELIRGADSEVGKLTVFEFITAVGDIERVTADIAPIAQGKAVSLSEQAAEAMQTECGNIEDALVELSGKMGDVQAVLADIVEVNS